MALGLGPLVYIQSKILTKTPRQSPRTSLARDALVNLSDEF